MTPKHCLVDCLHRLRRSDRGAALPIVAAVLLVMLASIGSATDLGRIYLAKSQMQAGVDAAALAGARAFGNQDGSQSDRDHQVAAYFQGNFPPDYMGMGTLTPTADFRVVNGVNQTTVTANGNLPLLFMRLFGRPTQPITATARAQLKPRPLEVMVVLDNTGSMAGILDGPNTSMDALKLSMHNFLDVLFQGSTTRPELAIGMINYTITTNVGDILKKFGVQVKDMFGFTNANGYVSDYKWPKYATAWKGCVADDATHRDMSADLSVVEADAWDIKRTLPNDGTGMPKIQPFFYPPVYVPSPKNDNDKANPASTYYQVRSGEAYNNLFLMDLGYPSPYDDVAFNKLANQDYYKPYFYRMYIGLNNGTLTSGDDVVGKKGGGYFAPTTGYDPFANPDDYTIDPTRIPNVNNSSIWKQPTTYKIIVGKSGNSWLQTPNPSPNFQCPEPGIEVAYGRQKQTYDDFIDDSVAPVRPGNGTMHHIGFLWGYRLLQRDDIFTRSNPTTEPARRALVFMTDGVTAFGVADSENDADTPKDLFYDRNYTAYGSVADKKIVSTADYGKYIAATELRFKKTCEAAKAETNPPLIYIVALNKGGTNMNSQTRAMFQGCATGGYYETTDTDALNSAFTQIATELVDLHLTR